MWAGLITTGILFYIIVSLSNMWVARQRFMSWYNQSTSVLLGLAITLVWFVLYNAVELLQGIL